MADPSRQGPSEKDRLRTHYERAEQTDSPSPGDPSFSSGLIAVEGADTGTSASSSHHAQPPLPPPYSGPSSGSQVQLEAQQAEQPRGPQKYPGLPRLDYRLYSPPLFALSTDGTTIKSSAPYLSGTVAALVSLVRAQSTVPPKPQIHITGTRSGRVDFAVKLNLMSLLVPEDGRQRMDYIRCVGAGEKALRGGIKPDVKPDVGEGGLEAWCRRFVEDPASVKTFCLERQVANMDTSWIEGQVRSLVASTGYKGVVAVQFPVTHTRVVVQNPDKVNKLFTNVTAFFSGRNTYEVVKAVWPFATHPLGTPGRRCVVQSEETWWKEWKDPLKYAISAQRKGWVTNEDKLEAIMEGKGKGVSVIDWGDY